VRQLLNESAATKKPSQVGRERRAAARARERRRQIYRRWSMPAFAVLALAGLALLGWLVVGAARGGRGGPPDGVVSFANLSQNHTQGAVAYEQTPPVGGEHAPAWQNCGYYDAPIRNELGVHSLEHGAVWITYRPDLPGQDVDRLRQLPRGQTHVLVTPFPDLPSPVVASAWGRQLQLESADDPRIEQFIRAFQKGPQTPEPGATCSGAIGTPK
jgi:hypothetical protein